MTDELEILRPEVREAVREIVLVAAASRTDLQHSIATIRAELLRLAEDAAMFAHAVSLGQRYKQRAETAEAELAKAQNTIAAQQGTMGALKRKLALAEGELAALKARIADAPMGVTRVCPYVVCIDIEGDEPYLIAAGKNVRLVVEE